MAKRVRDYKAEERRRNELARQRGYTSRAQQRRAIETGKAPALAPKRIRSPRTLKAQAQRKQRPRVEKEIPTEIGGIAISPRQIAQDWSDLFARSEIAQYRPDKARELGVTRDEYTRAYLQAFVLSGDRYSVVRHNGDGASPDLYYWFVTLNQYMMADEYETRYGPVA